MPLPRHSYRFETAPYSYFLIRNYDDAKQDFLAGTISNPKFQYYPRFSSATINRRLAAVASTPSSTTTVCLLNSAMPVQIFIANLIGVIITLFLLAILVLEI